MTEDARQEQQAVEANDPLVTHITDLPVDNLADTLGPLIRALDGVETISIALYLTPEQTRRIKLQQLADLEDQIRDLEDLKAQLDAQVQEEVVDQS